MNDPVPTSHMPQRLGTAPIWLRILVIAFTAAGLGLVVGVAFILPALAYFWTEPGQRRVILLLLTAVCAIIVVRRSSRLLRVALDAAPGPWRLLLLGLYGLTAMSLLAAVLLRSAGRLAGP